jgi:hypothetical protein
MVMVEGKNLGPNYRNDSELGLVKRCTRCGEWWPADGEFYWKDKGVLHSWCKACITEWKRDRRARGITDQRGRLIRKVSV